MSENNENAKIRAYRRLDIIRKLLPGDRVANCQCALIPGKEGIEIYYSKAKGVATVKNVYCCDNIWVCPVCARKKAFQRRAQLIKRLANWQGGYFQFHLTMRHNKGQHLDELYTAQNKAVDLFKSGRWYQDFKKEVGLIGNITSREVTWSQDNGWHPHMHILSITGSPDLNEEAITDKIRDRWLYCLVKVGGVKEADENDRKHCCAVTFRKDKNESVDYPVKWGIEEEITLGSEKKGRGGETPFQVIERAYAIEETDDNWKALKNRLIMVFREFEDVYAGSRQLRYDKNLKKLLDLSDDDAPQSEEDNFYDDFDLIETVDREDYNKIIKLDKLFEFQKIWSSGSREVIDNYVAKIRIAV